MTPFNKICKMNTECCARVPLLHMCAYRTSEQTSITTYRSQSFRCPSDLRIATLLTNSNPVGAVLRCTHPNAICIPNRTGSSAETLDKANPENPGSDRCGSVQSAILYSSTLFTSNCARVPLLHMCAYRTSEHISRTI